MSFIRKIFPYICLIISTVLFAYTFYRSEVYWDGLKFYYYYKFYVLSVLIFLFSLFTFFISKKILEYIIILSITIFFTLYSAEFYFFIKKIKSSEKLIMKKKNIAEVKKGKYDIRTKLEFYDDLNNEEYVALTTGQKYYLKYANLSNIFPMSGVSNSKTIHCNENGYYSIYKSDRFGFNNPDEEWDKKVEYLFIGDSFVHGNCVNRPYDLSSIIRNLYYKNVLNLGYEHSKGPLLQYATLREYLSPNVKKIIWTYNDTDLFDLDVELNNEILVKYLNDQNFTQNLKYRQNEVDKFAKEIIKREILIERNKKNVDKFYFLNFIKLPLLRAKIYIPNYADNYDKFKEILKLSKDIATKNNSEIYFIFLPAHPSYGPSRFIEEVKNIVSDLQIPFLDINSTAFNVEDKTIFFPYGLRGHYNKLGYNEVAKAIYNFVEN